MEAVKNQETEQLSAVINEAMQAKEDVLGMGELFEAGEKMPRTFTPRGSKRNLVRQEITLKDGSKKVVWHDKKFNHPQYGNYHTIWNEKNTTAKVNSKRQMKLRGEDTDIGRTNVEGDTIK